MIQVNSGNAGARGFSGFNALNNIIASEPVPAIHVPRAGTGSASVTTRLASIPLSEGKASIETAASCEQWAILRAGILQGNDGIRAAGSPLDSAAKKRIIPLRLAAADCG